MKSYKIGLAGNPNVGKSTVFNALTGMHQHTGNWTGKTVGNAMGKCKYRDSEITFVDIPGTYSLMSNSEEEEIARDFICFEKIDAVIVVIDATAIERSLNLVYQICEITPNVIVCVNLLDEAKKKGIFVNLKELSNKLGIPVVGTIARKKKTLNSLLNTIVEEKWKNKKPKQVEYDTQIEEAISKIIEYLKRTEKIKNEDLYRWIALNVLEGDEEIIKKIENKLGIRIKENEGLQELLNTIHKEMDNMERVSERVVFRIIMKAQEIEREVCIYKNKNYKERQRKIDKILTSRTFGIPIMIAFLGVIFYLTIVGANYPSQILSSFFEKIGEYLYIFLQYIRVPSWLISVLINGMYSTVAWVVSVMLPPMAIFFPLFTFLEDLGYLPRIAFNLDNCFRKACASGKQALTMCMGFGCNAAGVTGCRIINTARERILAILTNSFVPCNGRFPLLIVMSSILVSIIGVRSGATLLSTVFVMLVVILGILTTFLISKILSITLLKGQESTFTLELPPYRKPQIGKILVRSIFDRTIFVLGRAIVVAAPAGIIIWILANVGISGVTFLEYIANFMNPFAKLMGLDGYILTAFIIGIPANEIVLPIILMSYLKMGTMVELENTMSIGKILLENGWTSITVINMMIFTLLHFPCATTLMTIKKETNSAKWTMLSFALPSLCGIILCMFTNFIYLIVN